jgi:uncharacterized protein YwqG
MSVWRRLPPASLSHSPPRGGNRRKHRLGDGGEGNREPVFDGAWDRHSAVLSDIHHQIISSQPERSITFDRLSFGSATCRPPLPERDDIDHRETQGYQTVNRSDIMDLIESSSLTAHQEATLASLRESIRIRPTPTPLHQLPLGASRFGGVPDLPPDFRWPLWKSSTFIRARGESHAHTVEDSPLHFLAQFRLEDLPVISEMVGGTREGWLCVFSDVEDQPWGIDPLDRLGWRVIHFEGNDNSLIRAETVPRPDWFPPNPCALSFEPCLTLPCEPPPIEMSDDNYEAYSELETRVCIGESDRIPVHRMFGHAQEIQNSMEEMLIADDPFGDDPSARAEPLLRLGDPGDLGWVLLLQIDSDESNLGWMWGDVGRMYFWIRRGDLRKGRFDKIWLFLQCC